VIPTSPLSSGFTVIDKNPAFKVCFELSLLKVSIRPSDEYFKKSSVTQSWIFTVSVSKHRESIVDSMSLLPIVERSGGSLYLLFFTYYQAVKHSVTFHELNFS